MTAKDVSAPIQKYFHQNGNTLQICGYSGFRFFYPDILIITKARLAIDVEVKISCSDFKADFKKHKHWNFERRLFHHNYTSYFYFACPKDLIRLDEIPDYAGLIYVDGDKVEIVKKAPRLQSVKVCEETLYSIAVSLSAKCIYGESYMNARRKEVVNEQNRA